MIGLNNKFVFGEKKLNLFLASILSGQWDSCKCICDFVPFCRWLNLRGQEVHRLWSLDINYAKDGVVFKRTAGEAVPRSMQLNSFIASHA